MVLALLVNERMERDWSGIRARGIPASGSIFQPVCCGLKSCLRKLRFNPFGYRPDPRT
jgi:hypothetical protein